MRYELEIQDEMKRMWGLTLYGPGGWGVGEPLNDRGGGRGLNWNGIRPESYTPHLSEALLSVVFWT